MSAKQNSESSFLKLIGFIPLITGPIVTYYIVKQSLVSEDIKTFITPHIPELWNFEAKVTTLVLVSALISLFIAFCVVGIILSRYATSSPNPLSKQDPAIILFFNRVILNTLEQIAIFLPILAYWTLKFSTDANKHEVLIFGILWVASRFLYILGYGLTLISKFLSLFRVYGFQTGLLTSVILGLRIFGKDIL
jgi:hypothetical protein